MRPQASIGLESAKTCRSNRSAFTRAELIATLGAIFLCAAVLLPSFADTGLSAEQVSCLNNLRQIGVAFQAWGNDYGDRRPWMVFQEGNTLLGNAVSQFMALSNHMSPALLSDPGERVQSKRVAQNWSGSPSGGFLHLNFQDNALSYILGTHATVAEAGNILVADRNVFFNGFGSCIYGFTPAFNVDRVPPSSFRGWTNGNHGSFGNVLLNDGRVEYTSSQRLYNVLFRVNDGSAPAHFLAPSN
jgi:hypothetical protein